MKKLSEYKDEEALDLLADLIEPASIIFSDKEIAYAYQSGAKVKAVKIAIKKHKDAVIEMLAILDGVPVEEYHCNIFTLPMRVLDIMNDGELLDFFTYQGQEMAKESFTSVMASIEDDGK